MEEVFLVTSTFVIAILCTAFVTWKWLEGVHEERMAMIEQGMSPTERPRRPGHPLSILKWALLFTLVGIGLLAGIILATNFRVVEEATPMLGLISGGIALLIYYRIVMKKME